MQSSDQTRTALVIGASGLVGGYCLDALLREPLYSEVHVLVRRPLNRQHEKLKQIIIDFNHPDKYKENIKGQDIYCCIGTTVLKSPKREDYFRIDFEYPVSIAKIALANGSERFALISALSANSKSLLFYSRVKGQLEDAITQLKFKSVVILRPSYLIGDRKEFRPIEKMGAGLLKLLSPILVGPLRQYRAILAKVVGESLVLATVKHSAGIHIYDNEAIQGLYEEAKQGGA